MTERTRRVPMSDETLDREIREALAVDPSPAFLPRVRNRISNDSAAARQPRWALAVASAIGALAIAAVIWVPRSSVPEGSLSGRSSPEPSATRGESAAPRTVVPLTESSTRASVSAPQTSGRRSGSARLSQRTVPGSSTVAQFPEVIVSDVQMQAIGRLVEEAREAMRPAPAPIVTQDGESVEGIDLPSVRFTQVAAESVVFDPVMFE